MQPMFGGSVNRGTDVNGISDVDVLLIVNQSSLANQPPSEVITYVRDTIDRRLPNNSVRSGNLCGDGRILRRHRDSDTARNTQERRRRPDCPTGKY